MPLTSTIIRRIFALVLIATMAMWASAETFVMSIGVAHYADSANDLEQPAKDAKMFNDLMVRHSDKQTLLTSKYANRQNILTKLQGIAKMAKEGDKIVVFYSGHGYPGGIFPHDEAIGYQEINDILAASKASAKVCIINACYTGSVSGVNDNIKEFKAPTKGDIVYMMSSRADEPSYGFPITGHGVFTMSVLKGLRGKADADGDKRVTVKELFRYVYNDVQHTVEGTGLVMHPQLIGQKSVAETVLVNWK